MVRLDFEETFAHAPVAPVVRIENIRWLFALAAYNGLYILHADAKTAVGPLGAGCSSHRCLGQWGAVRIAVTNLSSIGIISRAEFEAAVRGPSNSKSWVSLA